MKKWLLAVMGLVLFCLLPGCVEQTQVTFRAVVLELDAHSALVSPIAGEAMGASSDRFSFSVDSLQDIGATVGDRVRITCTGTVRESYPAQIDVLSWALDQNN